LHDGKLSPTVFARNVRPLEIERLIRERRVRRVCGNSEMPLSPQWRRALEILADADLSGVTDAELMAQGFSAEMLASLALSGRTVATVEAENGGERLIKIVRMRITDAGRRELDV
jgi:hypothetical protein